MGLNDIEKRILQNIDPDATTRLLRDLIRIPSPNPPGDTRRIADYLVLTLREKGFHPRRIKVEENHVSVVTRIEGSGGGRSLVLNGHIDTVPIGERAEWTVDPLAGELRNERIFGRGATDCKSGVAALVIAAEAIRRTGLSLRGDVILAMVAGEETLSDKGTGYLVKEGWIKADAGVVTEPTTLPLEEQAPHPLQIFAASRGMFWFEIVVKGRAVHSKVAHLGVNAIEKMARIVLAFQSMKFEPLVEHPLSGRPSINVGLIAGGTSPSVVPDRCVITLDRGAVYGEDGAAVVAQIEEIVERMRQEDSALNAEVKVLLAEGPVEISQDEPIVTILSQGIEDALGGKARIGGMIGANDSRQLIRQGIPTVVCGPGITTQSHSIDEYVETGAVVNAAKAYALLMARFCG
jgi:acetylornithine deacetylase/succinyl-diaminopimelate desuccinylase family protein